MSSMETRLPNSVRFHPTEAELINYLERFLKGEPLPSPCPLRLADIYGDEPPWQIFGASDEKVCYFITPLKKLKKSNQHYSRTCANGTWRGQTSGTPIKNRMETVVGFRRNFVYKSKEQEKNSTTNWLMREYFVGDDFFRKNNIPQQDFVVCRIKKNIKEKKVKDVEVTYNMEEHVVAGIIEVMLHEPADDHCTTQPAENQVMDETDEWDIIIDGVCNQHAEVENTTTSMQGEYDLRGCNKQNDQILLNTYKANMDNQNITWSSTTLEQEDAYGQIVQVQGDGADDIGSNEFWEAMNRILEDIIVDIPDDLCQFDAQSSLLLD